MGIYERIKETYSERLYR